ncbi:MAG TPA: ribbon-helix-helix protein, CopG family [Phycisphaerales bacterium]|nr:ribbon-helix-helix protein, CopG family [Phycisphaerales bacterium]
MKTTVEISDALFEQLRKRAQKEGATMRELIEAALRAFLTPPPRERKPFRLKDGSVGGRGLQPGVDLSNWSHIRDLAYQGRGG